MTETEWKQIPEYPGYYASSDGQIRGLSGRILKCSPGSGGYRRATLYVNGDPIYREVHILVLEAFHGPNPGGMETRHLNGNLVDNRAENLKWGTRSENIKDQVIHGTHPWASRKTCPRGHEYDRVRKSDGARLCSKCARYHKSKHAKSNVKGKD